MKKLVGIILSGSLIYSYSIAQINTSADAIHWNKNYQLSWTDFQGEPMDFSGLGAEATCFLFANYTRATAFSKLKFHIEAVFDRSKSWVSPKAKSDLGLTYFRLMFDLYELHARQLRKELSETKFGIDPNPLFQEKYNNTMQALTDEFNEFRKQTKMGTDKAALDYWNNKIFVASDRLKEYME